MSPTKEQPHAGDQYPRQSSTEPASVPGNAGAAASVTVYPDGPLLLRGDAELRTVDGEVLSSGDRTVALCRCGHSATVPFCDGTHKQAQFHAAARTEAAQARSQRAQQ